MNEKKSGSDSGHHSDFGAGKPRRWTPLRVTAFVAASLFTVIVGFPVLFGFLGSWNNVDAGHVAVLRNGGMFSDSNVRGFLDPASSLSYTGIWSTEHVYPAQQRTYTISANPNQGNVAGVDVVQTPSSDGVEMGLQGTLYYSLNLSHQVLGSFDNAYGTRTYATGSGSQALHAYDGDDGWEAFMATVVRPVLNNDLREAIANTTCAQLDSACALVQNSSEQAASTSAVDNNGNIAAVQSRINASLQTDIDTQLGGNYLVGVRFTISQVSLPSNVQTAVNNAQAAFADVSQQQALVEQAKLQAQANEAKQAGYNACPACQEIDELKALPPNLTTYAPGAGTGIAIGK